MIKWFKKNWKKIVGISILVATVIALGALTVLDVPKGPEPVVVEEQIVVDYDQAMDATVILIGGWSMTSGVIISPDGYILSCAHGGPPELVYALTYYDDMEMRLILKYDVEIVFMDRDLDIGIYKISDPKSLDREWAYAPISMKNLEVSQDVFSVGCPLGNPFYLSWGKMIKDLYQPTTGQGYWVHSCSTNQGNSGGPLFNMKGEVVGINVFMYCALATMAGYVPLIDGCMAIKINDFMPAIWGIIETHKNLQIKVNEFEIAQKHINNLDRKAPN